RAGRAGRCGVLRRGDARAAAEADRAGHGRALLPGRRDDHAARGPEVLGPRRDRGRRARALAHAGAAHRAGRDHLHRVEPQTLLAACVGAQRDREMKATEKHGKTQKGVFKDIREKTVFVSVYLWLARIATPAVARGQATRLLIVVGLAGDPEHGELFKKWGTTLADTAEQKLGVAKDHVTLLTDAAATRDGVVKACGTLAAAASGGEPVGSVVF